MAERPIFAPSDTRGTRQRHVRSLVRRIPAMTLSPADIIEAVLDPLAMGDLGEGVDAFRFDRLPDESVLLDWGDAGASASS